MINNNNFYLRSNLETQARSTRKKDYACPKCNKLYESLTEYTDHRLECNKNKKHTEQSLKMIGLIEDSEEKALREKILKYEEKIDKNFKAGKF